MPVSGRGSDAIEPFTLSATLGQGQAEPWVLALMAASDGSLWVANGSDSPFPFGYGVTEITPTPAP